MENNEKLNVGSVVIGAAIGAAALGLLNQYEEIQAMKSQSELDDPDAVEDIYSDVDEFLEHFEFSDGLCNEKQYQLELANALNVYFSGGVEYDPSLYGMKPDVLIEGLVAIEIKLSPSKVELDRLVGQLAGYAQEWKTLILLIDTPSSKIKYLEELLVECSLGHLDLMLFGE